MSLASATDTVEVYGCTFAYNVAASSKTAGGFTISQGKAIVRNSIFYGNTAVGVSAHYGRDVSAVFGASLDIDYSLVTDSGDAYISTFTPGNCSIGDHMVYGDPRFGTTLAQANACKSSNYYVQSKLPDILAFNLHENALADGEGYSRAVDTGTGDFTNEPAPNGGVRNLGVYGNTTEAAVSSALGTPVVTEENVSVTFADDTKPTVTVTPGGDVNYNAHILIEIADTDPKGGSFEGWIECGPIMQ